MCGFAGFVSFTDSLLTPDERAEILERMGTVLSRRGPDEQTVYDDGYLSFVFRRLSIVDVAGGSQPIWNEERSMFVSINGEIYNHQEFREQLKDTHQFSTQSDSEAVLHLFEEYGADCFSKLNGMFAVMLYDSNSKSLTLARDRLGIKPLYWVKTGNGLIFASELKALLLHPECPREINWRDLDLNVIQQKRNVPTYLNGVNHLLPGSHLSVSPDGEISSRVYWSIDDHFRHEDDSFDPQAARDEYTRLISDSTTKRLMSDVPVGLFLSGGIDSSLLAGIAAKSKQDLHCFTVVENTTVASGDAPTAVDVTNELGVPLYAAHFDYTEIARNFTLRDFERMIVMIESPRFNPEWLFKSELHRFAKSQVPDLKVILLGQGADEFAGGYSNRVDSGFADWNDYLSTEVAADVRQQFGIDKGISGELTELVNLKHFDASLDSRAVDYHEKMRLHVYQMQHFNLWHEDRSSSFNGVEARVPYLDHRLVEFMAGIPDSSLEELCWDKAVVREALSNCLENYPENRAKVGFISTERHSTIDEMVRLIATNIYSAFRMLYLEMEEQPLFIADKLDEIHAIVESGNNESILNAWKLIAMMSLAVFEKFCRNPEVFLDFMKEDERPVQRRLTAEELDRLDELYPEETVSTREWSMTSTVRIPDRIRLLSGLDNGDESTDVYLHMNGQVTKTLTIPHSDKWVVELLEKLANNNDGSTDVQYWSEAMKREPDDLVDALNYLIGEGFLERST
jgi:asparagine synthase (glutamine-hydrolysing)